MQSRKIAREQTFYLIFEKIFNDDSVDNIIETASEIRTFEIDEYIKTVFAGVYDNLDRIDLLIAQSSNGWKISRISKVSLAIMRLAVYEILFMDDIPVSVSINEAVELAKQYGTDDSPSFINGVLAKLV